jgi:predicted dehydrogenase
MSSPRGAVQFAGIACYKRGVTLLSDMDLEVPTRFDERDWAREVDGGPVRFAVIGLGWFGPDVAIPAIAGSDYCETTVCVSGDRAKAERVADEKDAEYGLTYDEYADGEAVDAYDAVYIVTPNALHLPHVETAAEYGKDVLCEKPLEATAERAEKVVETCEEAGVELMTAYRMQTTRSVRWARELVQSGVIGEPQQVKGEFSFNMLYGGGDPDQWRLDPDLAGGGSLMDVGVYPLNAARFVLDADPEAVHASITEDPPEFDGVDKHASFTMEFPGGVQAQCSSSYGVYGANTFEVIGTEGRIRFDPIFNVDDDRRITIHRDHGETVVEAQEPPEMVEEFDYFATGLLTDMEIGPDGEHGHFDVRITEAVQESAETGERVEL